MRPALAAGLCAVSAIAATTTAAPAAADTLTVYTYRSFTSSWGPGPAIEEAFEKECACTLDWVSLDDSVGLLSRLRLEGETTRADVVLGLDLNLVEEARATGLLAEHGVDTAGLDLPIAWTDPHFVPFDWGHFAFVYDETRLPDPPASFAELIGSDIEILIQDPRTSTPGLGLVLWIEAAHGERAGEIWEGLRERVVTVTPGWSEAYGLFLDGEADMVLSYTTSPAYHMIAEDRHDIKAAAFEEGHYLQVEVAAMLATSDRPELARRFMAFVLEPGFQDAIPTGNWMYPAVLPGDGLPDAFDRLITPARTLLLDPARVAAERRRLVDAWLAVMAR
jgi:thiamine transport system substrate-binding protein